MIYDVASIQAVKVLSYSGTDLKTVDESLYITTKHTDSLDSSQIPESYTVTQQLNPQHFNCLCKQLCIAWPRCIISENTLKACRIRIICRFDRIADRMFHTSRTDPILLCNRLIQLCDLKKRMLLLDRQHHSGSQVSKASQIRHNSNSIQDLIRSFYHLSLRSIWIDKQTPTLIDS